MGDGGRIPPGWYDDGHGVMRWWDGTQWTEQVAPSASNDRAAGQPPERTEPDASPPPGSTVISQSPPTASGETPPAGTTGTRTRGPGIAIAIAVGAVVLAALIAGAALLIPLAMNGAQVVAASATPSPSAKPTPEASPEAEPTADTVSEADMAAAVATVEAYSDAWLQADCDAYFATTTERYRQLIELTECEAFYVNSRGWVEGIDDYAMSVVEAEQVGDSVAVSISETYTSAWDPEGNPLDGPTAQDVRTEYIVVEDQGAWKVDDDLWE